MSPTRTWLLACLRRFGWLPALYFVVHLVLARGIRIYLTHPEADDPMHFFGGVTIAWFFRRSVGCAEARAVLGELSATGRALLALAATGSATVLWEFGEWSTDRLGVSTAQLGLDDTMLDMFLGCLGGLSFLAVAAWGDRRSARAGASAAAGERATR